jgi:hypothetical protein
MNVKNKVGNKLNRSVSNTEIKVIPAPGILTISLGSAAHDHSSVLACRWRRLLKALARQHGLKVVDFAEGRMERSNRTI